jgi:hypothetical protein
LSLEELINLLQNAPDQGTKPGEALWIRFARDKERKQVEYRTATDNEILHVYLDGEGALVGIEIFS